MYLSFILNEMLGNKNELCDTYDEKLSMHNQKMRLYLIETWYQEKNI